MYTHEAISLPKIRPYNPEQVSSRHQTILRLKHLGLRDEDIADEVGINASQVRLLIRSELGKAELRRLQQTAEDEAVDGHLEIQRYVKKCIEVIGEMVENENNHISPSLRFKAAQDMLDRAGYNKVTKFEGAVAHGYVNQKGVEVLRQRAIEMGYASGNVIDVEPQDGKAISAEHTNASSIEGDGGSNGHAKGYESSQGLRSAEAEGDVEGQGGEDSPIEDGEVSRDRGEAQEQR